MITRLTVENFKALRKVTVDLAPFTVLIGPNDSGKSSFLEAVYALAESVRSPIARCFLYPWQGRELVYMETEDIPVRFEADLASWPSASQVNGNSTEKIRYELAVSFARKNSCEIFDELIGPADSTGGMRPAGTKGHQSTALMDYNSSGKTRNVELIPKAAGFLKPPVLARWDAEELARPSRLPPVRKYPFDPSGYGLATCIAEMKLGKEHQFARLREEFCQSFPTYQGISIQRSHVRGVNRDDHFQKIEGGDEEGYALVLVRKDGVEIPAAHASGGTLVTLAFLTLTHLEEPRKLLLIEEPENGLHPGRLKEIVQVLRRTVASQQGSQVILTTHSPLLLDYVAPEEVRLFTRNQQDDVEVYNIADVPDIHDRLKYLMLGELVYNEGENGLVEEIRQSARADSGRRADPIIAGSS